MSDGFVFEETALESKGDPRKPVAFDYAFIMSILYKRRWMVIIPFCLVMLAGIYLAVKLPKIYETSTLIMVEPQRVPREYVRPVVTEEIGSRISTISQQIMSRTNLEKIIEQFNLYAEPEKGKWYIEDKIEDLRKRITVRVSKSRSNDTFSIAFEGTDPEQITKITNTLVNYFIEENIRFRESKATSTSSFLDDELRVIRERLEKSEQQLKDYRAKNMGGLPEQLGSNLAVLERLQQQLNAKQEALRDAKNRLAVFNIESSAITKYSSLNAFTNPANEPPDDITKLAQMRLELDQLRSRYTNSHPDIIRLKKSIKLLRREIRRNPGARGSRYGSGLYTGSQRYIREARLQEFEQEIRSLENEAKDILTRIDYYQKLVEETPKREQELFSIQRDYQNVQQSYNRMLDKKLQAEIAVNLEKKQKGEQFRVIDPARVPTKPVRPNLKKMFVMMFALGLGIGGGLIFLFEFMDTSFRRYQDAESYLGIPVLVTIPKIDASGWVAMRRIGRLMGQATTVMGVLTAVMLFGVFAALSLHGVKETLELARKFLAIPL